MTRNELKNSNIWKDFFEKVSDKLLFDIKIYSDIGYEIKDTFFKKFQVNHNLFKNREKSVEVKLDFLKKNIDSGDFFFFLTEDSVPIKKFDFLYQKLSENNKSIFEYHLDPHVSINDGREKYGSVRYFDYPEEIRYKNNDWICLNRHHAKILVDNFEECLRFNYDYGGEHFVASILNKYDELQNVLTYKFVYENWDGYNGRYPSIFNMNDFEKIKNIVDNNPCSFFLRKFDEDFHNTELIQKLYDYN
jgi:hypothetical protein